MLSFKVHEKNLFHQPRSWIAQDADGYYVIEKAATEDKYQARYDQAGQPQILLMKGMWLPSLDRAQDVCEQDRKERQRARITARASRPAETRPAQAAAGGVVRPAGIPGRPGPGQRPGGPNPGAGPRRPGGR
jgi:hypothetical protein